MSETDEDDYNIGNKPLEEIVMVEEIPEDEIAYSLVDHSKEGGSIKEPSVVVSKNIRWKDRTFPCIICKSQPSKYRFNCCRFGYCSCECFKVHKESGVCYDKSKETDIPSFKRRRECNPLKELDLIPEEDILSNQVLSKLKSNQLVRECLRNNPSLRKVITRVDFSRDRNLALEKQMLIDNELNEKIQIFLDVIGFQN